ESSSRIRRLTQSAEHDRIGLNPCHLLGELLWIHQAGPVQIVWRPSRFHDETQLCKRRHFSQNLEVRLQDGVRVSCPSVVVPYCQRGAARNQKLYCGCTSVVRGDHQRRAAVLVLDLKRSIVREEGFDALGVSLAGGEEQVRPAIEGEGARA